MADVRIYLYMCFSFYTSCLKEMLLQTLKHSVWVTSTRIVDIVLSPVHQCHVDCYTRTVYVFRDRLIATKSCSAMCALSTACHVLENNAAENCVATLDGDVNRQKKMSEDMLDDAASFINK
jgi:hypothetical protein